MLFLHPQKKRYYLRADSANRVLAKEKAVVFDHLMGALGSRSVTLANYTITERVSFGRVKVRMVPIDAKAEQRIQIHREERIKISSTWGRPQHRIEIPPEVKSWVDTHTEWDILASSRTKLDRTSLDWELELTEKAEYAADVVASYRNMGFKVGGD